VTKQGSAFKFIVQNKERPKSPPNSVTVGKAFSPPGDAPDDDTVEFTIVLKQNNTVKYTLKVNKTNGWSAKISNVVPGIYDVEEINIPDGYEMVSLSHSSVTIDSTSTITITAINRKKIPPTTQPTTPAPATEPTSKSANETTTEPKIQSTTKSDTNSKTTEAATQPVNTTAEPITETKEALTTESPTQPLIDTPTSDEEEFEEVTEKIPLIGLTPDDETTKNGGIPEDDEYEEIPENTPPLVNITFPERDGDEEKSKPNPDTGDGGMAAILALMALTAFGAAAKKIRRRPR
jgi:hypothetical protein